jgi:hypothetical protein
MLSLMRHRIVANISDSSQVRPFNLRSGRMVKDESAADLQKRISVKLAMFIGGGIGVFWGFFLGGGVAIPVTGILMALLARFAVVLIPNASSAAVSSFLLPDARGGAGVGYSHIEALEARGDIAGALVEWERVIGESPDALAARITAAELYSRKSDNHRRAEQLYRSVQTHVKAPDETKRYVTQRLIDLYLGPIKDEGRALVELRRVASRWPDSPEGKGARQAIANIKNL